MSPDPRAESPTLSPPELLATLFPDAFIERLIDPLFASPEGAAVAVRVLGAPLAHVCASRARQPAVDLADLHGQAASESLRGRKIRERAIGLLADLADESIRAVAMKGLAMACDIYPRPAYRLLPDVDILFFDADLPRLARYLSQAGYRTAVDPGELRPWGVLAKASFAPIFPPDHGLYLDVHRDIDEWPASRGLNPARLFDHAGSVDTEWGPCPVVSREHGFVIAALNAYRDFYRPEALKGLFDVCLLLCRHGGGLDLGEIEAVARRGGFVKRILFYRELLAALGAPRAALFEERRLSRPLKRLLATVVENYQTLGRHPISDVRKIVLEASLLDSPWATVLLNGRRLYHMAAPRMHYLPGVPVVDFADLP